MRLERRQNLPHHQRQDRGAIRSGVPDFFDDERDYQGFVERLQKAGAIRDATYLWWAIRPAMKFPTLELRIADVCTRMDDAIALAALFRCLIAMLVRNPEYGAERTTHTRRLIDENRWLAKRDGVTASPAMAVSTQGAAAQQSQPAPTSSQRSQELSTKRLTQR